MSTPRTPILWSVRPTSTPGQARSTMKAVTESWARLVGIRRLGEHRVPVRLPDPRHPALGAAQHPPAGRVGIGCGPGAHPHDVAPGLGLGQTEGGALRPRRRCPGGTAASAPRCRRSSPVRWEGGSAATSSAAVFEYLATSSMATAETEDAGARSPVLLGEAQPEQPRVAKGVEDVGRGTRRSSRWPAPGASPCPAPGGGRSPAARRAPATARNPCREASAGVSRSRTRERSGRRPGASGNGGRPREPAAASSPPCRSPDRTRPTWPARRGRDHG